MLIKVFSVFEQASSKGVLEEKGGGGGGNSVTGRQQASCLVAKQAACLAVEFPQVMASIKLI